MELVTDLGPVRWLEQAITTFAVDVTSLVPDGFQAYARVLHPAGETRWSEIAAITGRLLHPEVQWQHLVAPAGGVIAPTQWDAKSRWTMPEAGTLPPRQRLRLSRLLTPFTSTPSRAWFALWDGYGDLAAGLREPGQPRLRLPHRDYIVFFGDMAELSAWPRSGPNLWWPEDRAWFVCSEIDLVSTYVAGSSGLVAKLAADAELEALPVPPTGGITAAADRLNR